jgi:hypothetical protein
MFWLVFELHTKKAATFQFAAGGGFVLWICRGGENMKNITNATLLHERDSANNLKIYHPLSKLSPGKKQLFLIHQHSYILI